MLEEKYRREILHQMGISVWQQRRREQDVPAPAPALVTVPLMPLQNQTDWTQLAQQVAACTACDLHRTRKQTVFGVGNQHAAWLFIGEAPGEEEDRQGEPFVGKAGQLLNAMLFAMGLKREEIYIANILKCRPPQNRDPLPEEVTHCEQYLFRQIALIQPKIIVTLGRIAAQNLLKTTERIGLLRGRRFSFGETHIPVVATYHPAYLLRSPREKRKAWQDLLFAKRLYLQYADTQSL